MQYGSTESCDKNSDCKGVHTWANGFEKLLEDPKGLQTFAVSALFFLLNILCVLYIHVYVYLYMYMYMYIYIVYVYLFIYVYLFVYVYFDIILNEIVFIQGVSQKGV